MWIETHGKEPQNLGDTEYGWIRWETGEIALIDTCGYIAWDQSSHFHPAPEISSPKFDG